MVHALETVAQLSDKNVKKITKEQKFITCIHPIQFSMSILTYLTNETKHQIHPTLSSFLINIDMTCLKKLIKNNHID